LPGISFGVFAGGSCRDGSPISWSNASYSAVVVKLRVASA
jgi:hypothetical protein